MKNKLRKRSILSTDCLSICWSKLIKFGLLTFSILLLLGHLDWGYAADDETTEIFMPFVQTSFRQAPAPTQIKSFPLPDASCSNDIAINSHTGTIYITNEESDNISLIRNLNFAGNVKTGDWPIYVESDPLSDMVYVSHVVSGISIFNNDQNTAQIPPFHESYFIVVNTINGYTYVTDLHRPITILQGSKKVVDLFVPNFKDHTIEWQLAVDFDELTGLTYFASWQKGIMTVVDGTTVIDQFDYNGEGAKDMVIDPYRRLIYVANFRAGEGDAPENNISIIHMDTKKVTPIFTGKHSRHLAMDPQTGLVYATNPEDDTVTVMRGTNVLANYETGDKPWGVTVDQRTGYAYVTNSEDNSISIFKDGQPIKKLQLAEGEGFQPWYVAVDESSNEIYILNRSSKIKKGYLGHRYLVCKEPWVHILSY